MEVERRQPVEEEVAEVGPSTETVSMEQAETEADCLEEMSVPMWKYCSNCSCERIRPLSNQTETLDRTTGSQGLTDR